MSDRIRGIAEFAYSSTRRAIEAGGTSRYAKLARKLHVLVDGEIEAVHKAAGTVGQNVACKKGCDACCNRLVGATVPELLTVLEHVQTAFTPAQIDSILLAMDKLDEANAEFWDTRSGWPNGACPFLVDHSCSIYEVRPLTCRTLNAFDPAVCHRAFLDGEEINPPGLDDQSRLGAVTQQVVVALKDLHLRSGLYELGPSLRALLKDAAALDSGALDRYKIASEFDRQFPDRHQLTDTMMRDAAKREIVDSLVVGTPEKTWRKLDAFEGTPFGVIYRMQMPDQYNSQDELEMWWERFDQSLTRFEESRLPARETFELLQHFNTFSMAYAGRDVKPYMSRLMNVVQRYAAEALPDLTAPIETARRPGKPRLGFISYRIKRFNGSRWSFGWLKNISPEIETYVINLAVQEDKISLAFRRRADMYIHASGIASEVAPIVRSLDLDALIFTDIGMDGHSLQLASLRMARRQMNSWGHPVTCGSPMMDDYLSSILMEPENGDHHYTERLQRLPGSGVTYPRLALTPSRKTHTELGVPETGFLLCCQLPFKITPSEDHFLVELAARSDKPIIFIGGPEDGKDGPLQRRLKAQGVNLVFVPRLERADYLRLLQLADTSLDLPSWNGGNTTIEALALGTPVVSLPGEFMRGRHALAFLNQANVPELIARDAADYIDLALSLDRQREIMKKINIDGLYEDPAPAAAISKMLIDA